MAPPLTPTDAAVLSAAAISAWVNDTNVSRLATLNSTIFAAIAGVRREVIRPPVGGKTFRQGMGRGISIPGRGERSQCFLMTGFILDHRSQKTGAVEEVPHGRDSLVAAIAATASKVCPVRGTTISPDLRRSSGPGGSTGVSSNRLPTRVNRSTDPDERCRSLRISLGITNRPLPSMVIMASGMVFVMALLMV